MIEPPTNEEMEEIRKRLGEDELTEKFWDYMKEIALDQKNLYYTLNHQLESTKLLLRMLSGRKLAWQE